MKIGLGAKTRFLLAAILLLSPGLASAQQLAGVTLGHSQEELLAAHPGWRTTPVTNMPGAAVILTGGSVSIGLCNGQVSWVMDEIGSTLHDYAATVLLMEATHGDYSTYVHNERTGVGEISWLESRWEVNGFAHLVTISHIESQAPSVTRSITTLSACE